MDKIVKRTIIFKNYKIYSAILIALTIIMYVSFSYLEFINTQKNLLQQSNYKLQADSMIKRVSDMILVKQKATVAMALSLANDIQLANDIKNKTISKDYYKNLIKKFRENTQYKNIWIHLLDNDLNSLYRSWTKKKGDNLKGIRGDISEVMKTKRVTHTISYGKYDLSIKAIVPIFNGSEILGVIEVISHFNSIAKQMKKFDINSIVVLDKKFSSKLKYPFTNRFIDGYYIANLNVPEYLIKHFKKEGVQKHFTSSYFVDGAYISIAKELKSINGETLGFYIMNKKIENISTIGLDFFMFKGLAFGFLVLMVLATIINFTMFYVNAKQKKYYKNIIDSSTNIMLINDKKNIINVNKMFFKYFYNYQTLEEFKRDYNCICDMFVDDSDYIQKNMNGLYWIDYLLKNSSKKYKVKIKYINTIYYFSVGASLVYEDKNYYSVVFSDITKEENYKIELELLSVTDALTGIGNRRYFHTKILEEISRADRYNHALSFIMCDIDYFKKVNDIHGHGIGDEVLVEYTKLISSVLREGDIFARIGGEEFFIILPHTDRDNAKVIAEKLRKKVEEHKIVLPITMSFGVCQYTKDEKLEFLLKRVDEALYEAKDNGRNMVVSK